MYKYMVVISNKSLHEMATDIQMIHLGSLDSSDVTVRSLLNSSRSMCTLGQIYLGVFIEIYLDLGGINRINIHGQQHFDGFDVKGCEQKGARLFSYPEPSG